MSGNSSVTESELGVQRNSKDSEKDNADRFHQGKAHSHKANDSKDQRSIANKLEREEKRESEPDKKDVETEQLKKDPTLPARSHGNEPSKGAKIDAELQAEEEEELRRKGKSVNPK